MDAVERIEVALRTQICLSLALTYQDSHWFMRKELFSFDFEFEKFLCKCENEFSKSKEAFVCYYKENF